MEEVKTPKQMAEEWSETQFREQDFIGAKLGTERAFLAGYEAAELKAKMEFAAKYDHRSPLQVIAAEYVKRRGTIGPLALLEENRFIDGYEAGINSSKKLDSWISVKDRLPEDAVEVLVVSDGETGASWHEAGEFGWAIGGTVTHWAPLPKPPEE